MQLNNFIRCTFPTILILVVLLKQKKNIKIYGENKFLNSYILFFLFKNPSENHIITHSIYIFLLFFFLNIYQIRRGPNKSVMYLSIL